MYIVLTHDAFVNTSFILTDVKKLYNKSWKHNFGVYGICYVYYIVIYWQHI